MRVGRPEHVVAAVPGADRHRGRQHREGEQAHADHDHRHQDEQRSFRNPLRQCRRLPVERSEQGEPGDHSRVGGHRGDRPQHGAHCAGAMLGPGEHDEQDARQHDQPGDVEQGDDEVDERREHRALLGRRARQIGDDRRDADEQDAPDTDDAFEPRGRPALQTRVGQAGGDDPLHEPVGQAVGRDDRPEQHPDPATPRIPHGGHANGCHRMPARAGPGTAPHLSSLTP